jgi:hypothetical protein
MWCRGSTSDHNPNNCGAHDIHVVEKLPKVTLSITYFELIEYSYEQSMNIHLNNLNIHMNNL